jgi:prolyl-tRNA synthetase
MGLFQHARKFNEHPVHPRGLPSLVLPPKLAPKHVVIIPIYRNDEEKTGVLEYCNKIANGLKAQSYDGLPIQVELDDRDMRGGEKTWFHIKRGVPIRVEIGPRDMAAGNVFMGRRDLGAKEKKTLAWEEFIKTAPEILEDIQSSLFKKALQLRKENTKNIDSWDDFVSYFTATNEKKPEIHGGFAMCHWSAGDDVQQKLKDLKVTARCIPLEGPEEKGTCIFSGRPSNRRVIFAKSY